MWCPVGYVSFADALSHIEELEFFAYLKLTGQRADNEVRYLARDEEMVRSGLIAKRENGAFVRELMFEILLARLIEISPPLACSSTGTVMRIDDVFFTHADRLDWIFLKKPIDKMSEFSTYIRLHGQGNFNGVSVRRRYCFIDAEMGIISVKNNSKSMYESASHDLEETGSNIISIIQKFNGWSLCWKQEDLPNGQELLERAFPVSGENNFWKVSLGDGLTSVRRGRPQKVPQITKAYISAFPDGHGSLQREEVKRVIEPIVKFGFALDTLDKAIAASARKIQE